MLILGIESSCDETSVALLKNSRQVLSNIVASQNDLHAKFGGVVPEVASRRHIEMIVPLLDGALKEAGVSLDDIDAIAVTRAPGLIGALLIGVSFAKSLAFSLKKPLIGVNHLEGHLNAAHIENEDIPYPHIGMVVSGGHTSLYLVKGFGDYKLLGATRDDAAGEAFDKVAKLLGLGYPGGPIIDRLAKDGNPKSFKFTFPKISTGTAFDKAELDFSFSGLKTAVMLEVKKNGIENINKADLAASFQYTVVEIICRQILKACDSYKCNIVVISGGVAANSHLRGRLAEVSKKENLKLFIPSLKYCTDNAAMIAYVGSKKFELGQFDNIQMSPKANEEIGI